MIGYTVIEEYPDDAPEVFGTVLLKKKPEVDEAIMLKWLDGRDAYPVKVMRVGNDLTLYVTSELEK